MQLIKIQPDVFRAKSLYTLACLRQRKLSMFCIEEESSLLIEAYYEICKELLTSLLFLDGYKTSSHVDLINYLKGKDVISQNHVEFLHMLRKRRNKLVYYGVEVDSYFLTTNKKRIEAIITLLKKTIQKKIKTHQ